MAEPLQTEQQALIKQHPETVEITKKTCKVITGLAIAFLIANIICIAILFSIVLEEDESSSQKRVAGTYPVVGPYSTVIEANGFLFVSGQIAVINGTVVGDITAQTDMVLANIKNILEDAGSNMNKVVKCTIFLRNMSDFGTVNMIYMSYFNLSSPELDSYPARAAVAVRDLPVEAAVEIEAIALT